MVELRNGMTQQRVEAQLSAVNDELDSRIAEFTERYQPVFNEIRTAHQILETSPRLMALKGRPNKLVEEEITFNRKRPYGLKDVYKLEDNLQKKIIELHKDDYRDEMTQLSKDLKSLGVFYGQKARLFLKNEYAPTSREVQACITLDAALSTLSTELNYSVINPIRTLIDKKQGLEKTNSEFSHSSQVEVLNAFDDCERARIASLVKRVPKFQNAEDSRREEAEVRGR